MHNTSFFFLFFSLFFFSFKKKKHKQTNKKCGLSSMQAHGAPFYTWTQLDVESLMMIKLRISRFLPQEPYCLPHYRMPLFRLLVCICPIFKICSKSRCCPSLSSNNQWMVMLQVWFVSWTWSSVIWVAFVIFSQLRPLKPLFQLLFFLSCLDYCNSTVFLLIAPRTSISNYLHCRSVGPQSQSTCTFFAEILSLCTLNWLPIDACITHKIAYTCFCTINGTGPF